jgi:hypothetical protein
MTNTNIGVPKKFFFWIFLAYLAILPIAHTTALRNLLLLVLCSIVFFHIVFPSRDQPALGLVVAWPQIPWIWFAWAVYLSLFPLLAVQTEMAWSSFWGQWIKSLLAWIVGFFAVLLLGRSGPSLFVLAVASAIPVALHLLLTLAVWSGLLGNGVPMEVSVEAIFGALANATSFSQQTSWGWQSFPWGFRGLDPMHGNLGYAACQAIALWSVSFCIGWRAIDNRKMLASAAGILLCFLSILIASSRGAVFFGLIVLGLTAAIFLTVSKLENQTDARQMMARQKIKAGLMLVLAITALAVTAHQVVNVDSRWSTMFDKVRLGFLLDKPIEFLCDGVSPRIDAEIREKFAARGNEYAETLIAGLKGQDGGRILLMRAGFEMLLENPQGLDGSRYSYTKLIEDKCGHTPALQFAHAHQGWIDTSLSLGWGGAVIFAVLLLYLMNTGWQNLADASVRPWAFALFVVTAFWFLRGFADSVYREHYLQMQGILMAYLFLRMKLTPASRPLESSAWFK